MLPKDMPPACELTSCNAAIALSRLAFIGTKTRPFGGAAPAAVALGAGEPVVHRLGFVIAGLAPRGCSRRLLMHSRTSRAGGGVRTSSDWHSAMSISNAGSASARSRAGCAVDAASASASRCILPAIGRRRREQRQRAGGAFERLWAAGSGAAEEGAAGRSKVFFFDGRSAARHGSRGEATGHSDMRHGRLH